MASQLYQYTTRRIALAMFWLSVCLACWSSKRALDEGWPLLVGWFALWAGVAGLFGVALKYALGVALVAVFVFMAAILIYALSWITPPAAAIWVGLLVAAVAGQLVINGHRRRASPRGTS
jgi:hypothetical protein